MSVSRAKSEILATEFLRWTVYIQNDANAFHREDHFFADISYQLYLLQHILGGKPKLKREDFLIRFEAIKKSIEGAPAEETEEQRLFREARNKASILAHLGVALHPDGTTSFIGDRRNRAKVRPDAKNAKGQHPRPTAASPPARKKGTPITAKLPTWLGRR